MDKTGRLIVLTGPSGVGKGTLVSLLRQHHPDLFLSISATTRSPRPGEVNGVHYYFLTREAFGRLIDEGKLLEWAQYLDNYYGTPSQPVLEHLAQGSDVLLEIEVQGARQVLQNFPQALSIFILPPDLDTLRTRLAKRRTESPEAMEKRLTRAETEIAHSLEFSYQVVNDQLNRCLEQLESMLYPG
ncbi:guanylate kinase [Anthocerotibacter panamensis]|uniref:guanylate kinase n=1 Tax=Anthocerotibacter panamensis TaxID=2857077 RepID=UPI001C406FBB|nr:guanylate kinase [Anthocerotibacter panamensis]